MPQRGFPKPLRSPSNLLFEQPGIRGAVARFWSRSYAPDYAGLLALGLAYLAIQFFAEPFYRLFSLDDRSKSYPHALVQRVSAGWNVIYAGLVPGLIILVWAAMLGLGFHQAHVTVLGLLISHALTLFLTDVFKNAVGRPRPDLIARCKPAKGTPGHDFVTIHVCTEPDRHTLHDGWRSFPSGHSSFAFAGLGYLAL
jgi:diacylglycerol diphosphate phosphatase/phosphatidate phosphatase